MKDLPTIPWDDKPVDWQTKTGGYAKDMTLRDYFAAKAMEAKGFTVLPYDTTNEVAKECYRMADAMLKARNAAQ